MRANGRCWAFTKEDVMSSRSSSNRRRVEQQGRGCGPERHEESPALGWKDVLRRVLQGISDDHISLVAAGTAFFGLLAIFPAMTALVSLYGLVADPGTIRDHVEAMRGFVPAAGIEIIQTQLNRIVEQGGTANGITFLIGLATALWSANAGMKALFEAMNVAYDETENRSFVWRIAVSLALTLGAMLMLVLFMTAIAVVPAVIKFLGLEGAAEWLVSLLRWPMILILAGGALAVLYRFGPSMESARWRWISPGSVLASTAWIAVSIVLSWYLANFADYNETYGSIGAVIGLMMWFWLSAFVILVGAELNAVLDHQTAEDSTTDRERRTDRPRATTLDRRAATSREPA
jgi:membrane protein